MTRPILSRAARSRIGLVLSISAGFLLGAAGVAAQAEGAAREAPTAAEAR